MFNNNTHAVFYNGVRFVNEFEARWAVFFDACGVDWEYMPEKYTMDSESFGKYCPEFVLHLKSGDQLVACSETIFYDDVSYYANKLIKEGKSGIYVINYYPWGDTMDEIIDCIGTDCRKKLIYMQYGFNFLPVNGDDYPAHIGVDKDGDLGLFGDDYNYLKDMDYEKTFKAYEAMRNATLTLEMKS